MKDEINVSEINVNEEKKVKTLNQWDINKKN